MKKTRFLILVLTLLIALFSPSLNTGQAASSFKDVPSNHSTKKEIDYLIGLGIIKGYNDGTFRPYNNVTNAQAATMLVRALKLHTNGRPNPQFTDVFSTNPAFKEIATAVDAGIFPKSKAFYPNASISREAMARALVNAFKLQGSEGIYFTDVSESYWSYPYISKLAANQITTGYPDGSFKPKNTVTRAQFSAFVARSLNKTFKPRVENRVVTGGLKHNPTKSYVYNLYNHFTGYEKASWQYEWTNQSGWDNWTAYYEDDYDGEDVYYSQREDKGGMYFGWQDSEISFALPYPLTLNKKWSSERYTYEGDKIDYYVVTNIAKTITTPAGTFHNVIEIKDYDGYYLYYAQGIGHILTIDATQQPAKKTIELVEIY
ncbi:S-layer homology domain-containing protein [Metabacillus iocasae]|uniref:SLH domain-containing protein n=1 Tax=Priestia iocasae TaxID=2291674 RepID=A0ABS2QXY5_9BACI|nr:S-layer homology domain-containing protein [Metabacillus iocasae]MBM7704340.1 hypothetical protein [Metabacillus iocasae]